MLLLPRWPFTLNALVLLNARRKSLVSLETTPGSVRINDWKSRPFSGISVTCLEVTTNDFCEVEVSTRGLVASTDTESVICPTCRVSAPTFMTWFWSSVRFLL